LTFKVEVKSKKTARHEVVKEYIYQGHTQVVASQHLPIPLESATKGAGRAKKLKIAA
jgi:hypothetical protein